MSRPVSRTSTCSDADARNRLQQAQAFLNTAELVLSDDSEAAHPGVASALAVLSGIAATDAACCARLKQRARGQDHREAIRLVGSVEPGGTEMAKHLRTLLTRKDDAHYGLHLVSRRDARRMVTAD